jgi:HPr kinase/phosphorylase
MDESLATAEAARVHATCVIFGEAGILIRGRSGSGKTSLAREIIAGAESLGTFARLVADDRVSLANRHGRLVACAPDSIAGRMEIFGRGIVAVPHEKSAVIRLVVDLEAAPSRWPDSDGEIVQLCGVTLPRLVTGPGSAALMLLLKGLSKI